MSYEEVIRSRQSRKAFRTAAWYKFFSVADGVLLILLTILARTVLGRSAVAVVEVIVEEEDPKLEGWYCL